MRHFLLLRLTQHFFQLIFFTSIFISGQVLAAPIEYDVKKVEYKNLVAKLCLPRVDHKVPVVVAFGGSDGGMNEGDAYCKLLPPTGVAVIGLAYFKEKGLPATLDQIPLEYFVDVVDYALTVPQLDGARIGVVSGSRGSEAALLLGSIDTRIKSVVVATPSNVSWGGMTTSRAAWTIGGKDVPTLTLALTSDAPKLKRFDVALADKEAADKATIHVEKINGPILLVSARNDQIWPSYQMARKIEEYLQAASFKFSVTHASYPTGHGFSSETAPEIKQMIIDHFARTLGDNCACER